MKKGCAEDTIFWGGSPISQKKRKKKMRCFARQWLMLLLAASPCRAITVHVENGGWWGAEMLSFWDWWVDWSDPSYAHLNLVHADDNRTFEFASHGIYTSWKVDNFTLFVSINPWKKFAISDTYSIGTGFDEMAGVLWGENGPVSVMCDRKYLINQNETTTRSGHCSFMRKG